MAGVRKLENWLSTYLDFTRETESAPLFHKWVGISTVAAALQRKVWFNFGRIKVHPNLFIVLVSEPGIARKTQAIGYAEDLIMEIPNIKLAADCTTKEALLDDLERAGKDVVVQLPNGEQLTHNSLTIVSGEFETFIGTKHDNAGMLVTLTDFFDCKARPFRKRTRHSGDTNIEAVWLNLLAATTPESIAQSMPTSAIGGGLTSRIIYVWSEGKTKKIDVPERPPEQMRIELIHDLAMMAGMAGGYSFSPTAREWWRDWYNSYEEHDPARLCKDPTFGGWYSRKPTFMLKLCQIVTAIRHSEPIIEPWAFKEALDLVEETEHFMGRVFSAVGKSAITSEVSTILDMVRRYRYITETQLKSMVWRDMDHRKFDNILDTALMTGSIKRIFRDPRNPMQGQTGYIWIGGET